MDSVLRPRDIQARIRSGESPETVAAAVAPVALLWVGAQPASARAQQAVQIVVPDHLPAGGLIAEWDQAWQSGDEAVYGVFLDGAVIVNDGGNDVTGEGINLDVWESFTATQKSIIQTVCMAENSRAHAEFNAKNGDVMVAYGWTMAEDLVKLGARG